MAHAQKTPLKGKKFESLEEAQAYLDHWEEHWADKRIHLPGRVRAQTVTVLRKASVPYFVQAGDLLQDAERVI